MVKFDLGTGTKLFLLALLVMGFAGAYVLKTTGPEPTEVGGGGISPITPVSVKNTCTGGNLQSLIISGYSIDDITSVNTESTNLYRQVGETSWTNWTLGTAITGLTTGQDYEFVIGTGLTDHTDNVYGPHFIIRNLPCVVSFSIPVYNDEDESGVTAVFYNADDDAAAESWSANEVQTVSFKVKATAEEYFGNPTLVELDEAYTKLQDSLNENGIDIEFKTSGVKFPNILYLQLNSTEWDKPDKVYLEDGTELNSVSCPTRLSAATGSNNYCYEAPIIKDTLMRIYMDLNTDDSVAPATDDTFGYFAAGYYVNGDTGELEYGVEDEDDNPVGTDAAETATIDNT